MLTSPSSWSSVHLSSASVMNHNSKGKYAFDIDWHSCSAPGLGVWLGGGGSAKALLVQGGVAVGPPHPATPKNECIDFSICRSSCFGNVPQLVWVSMISPIFIAGAPQIRCWNSTGRRPLAAHMATSEALKQMPIWVHPELISLAGRCKTPH